MSSVFKGLTEYFGASTAQGDTFKEGEVFIGQVLDVGKSTSTYSIGGTAITPTMDPYTIGMIRFLRANNGSKAEKNVVTTAEPLDRSCYRLPFAGEQVLVVKKLGSYYYFDVVTPSFFLRSNINPVLMQDAYASSGEAAISVDPEIEAQRFATKNDFSEAALTNRAGSFTRVREGDSILEGRMGGLIKFTHTITQDGVWNPETQITNIGRSDNGDPMLVMKASIRRKEINEIIQETNLLEDDDINEDDSSFYLTTTQNVPMKVATSVSMLSWNVAVTKGAFTGSDDPTVRLQSLVEGTYDPNFQPEVITSGLNLTIGGGGGGTGGSGGAGGGNGAAMGLDTENALAYDLILKYEGTGYEAGWDIGNWRIGHGSSTITLENGVVAKLGGDRTQRPVAIDKTTGVITYAPIGNIVNTDGQPYGSGILWHSRNTPGAGEYPLITLADADRDLARRVKTEFVPDVIEFIGRDVANFIGIGGVAALTSIKYNYGNIKKQGAGPAAIRAFKENNINILVDHIKGLTAGPKRRAFEANVVLTKSM